MEMELEVCFSWMAHILRVCVGIEGSQNQKMFNIFQIKRICPFSECQTSFMLIVPTFFKYIGYF